MNHKELLDDAKDAIDKLFSDQSVGRSTTRESLEELKDEIETKLDALDSDDNAADE